MDFRTDDHRPARGYRHLVAAPSPHRLVRCGTCGRSEPVSALDLTGYMQTGWPRCCGDVMTYFLEADRPADEGTRFAYRCPACGHEWAITFPPGVEVVAPTTDECERCRRPATP